MPNTKTLSEADILEDIVNGSDGGLSRDMARYLLKLKFSSKTGQRIRRLLRRNQQGALNANERLLLARYIRVGQFLDLLQAKARLSLAKSSEID